MLRHLHIFSRYVCFQEGSSEAAVQKRQKNIFSQIPEFIIKDMASWFSFMASHGLQVHPTALAGQAVSKKM